MKKTKKILFNLGLVALGIMLATGTTYAAGKWKGTPNVEKTHDYLYEIETIINNLKKEGLEDKEYYEQYIEIITKQVKELTKTIGVRDKNIESLLKDIETRDKNNQKLRDLIEKLESELDNAYQDVLGIEQHAKNLVESNK